MPTHTTEGANMQVCQAREQYVRWLLVTRDLSPHTIRAYDGDIGAFERHLGVCTSVSQMQPALRAPHRTGDAISGFARPGGTLVYVRG